MDMTLRDPFFDIGQSSKVQRGMGQGAVHPGQTQHRQKGIQYCHHEQIQVLSRPFPQSENKARPD